MAVDATDIVAPTPPPTKPSAATNSQAQAAGYVPDPWHHSGHGGSAGAGAMVALGEGPGAPSHDMSTPLRMRDKSPYSPQWNFDNNVSLGTKFHYGLIVLSRGI